jgi:hypothetical protein
MRPRLSALKAAIRARSNPSSRSFVRLPVERLIDEETLPHYDFEQFYPVHIGDVFDGRYLVTGKLGFGAYSTSWLCQDLGYVPIDVKIISAANSAKKSKLCSAEGFYIATKVSHRDRPRVRDLQAPREIQINTPRTITNPRAL